jgi:uncharacterized protein
MRSIAVAILLAAATPLLSQTGPAPTPQQFSQRLVAAAKERLKHRVRYHPAYVKLKYPGGDVPADTGVCTDEVIRAYRALGIDLQKDVHEDMRRNFSLYPKNWGLRKADPNIDHRRVPNLQVFFSRKGTKLPITRHARDYQPGDLVTWDLGGNIPHIGMIVDVKSGDGQRYKLVHNIGAGPQLEDVLFAWKITGHYRYGGNGS